nr:hypothetical protein SHINE37_41636 [Rhizobiaceae bacterium]
MGFKPCLGLGEFTQFEAVFDTVEACQYLCHAAMQVVDVSLHDMHVISQTYDILPHISLAILERGEIRLDSLHELKHQFLRNIGHDRLLQPSGEGDSIVLDYRVGQQLVAHGLEVGLGLGAVGGRELQIEDLALADLADAVEAEAAEGALDRLALRVENTVFQRNRYACLDHVCLSILGRRVTSPEPGRCRARARSR